MKNSSHFRILAILILCVSFSKEHNVKRQAPKKDWFKNQLPEENIPEPTETDKKKYEKRSLKNEDNLSDSDLVDAYVNLNKRGKNKGNKYLPEAYAVNLDLLANSHPLKKLRSGDTSEKYSCNNVRSVPSHLRQNSEMYVGISSFYTKYTEAYGIPVIGSRNVTDEGLMRACYIVRIMFGSRWDIRRSFYKFFGRIVLIGDGEQQTSLPEYKTWDSSKWDKRVRGLGAVLTKPIVSAGDDNQRCKAGDRYFDQDILIHELCHGIETLAARFVVPGFLKRLKDYYVKNVEQRGKWAKKYAAENKHEYWAVGCQFYFNSFRGTSYHSINVRDRQSLARYDPDLYSLLAEVFPCSNKDGNLIHRCKWKECSLKSSFELVFDVSMKAKSLCDVIRSSYSKHSAQECAAYACYFQANAFNYKGSVCHALRCKDTSNHGLKLTQSEGDYNIYKAISLPEMTLKAENKAKVKSYCVAGPSNQRLCAVKYHERKPCGGSYGSKKGKCNKLGCCYDSDKKQCYYGSDECADKYVQCPDLANKGECKRNPYYLYLKCPMSCNVCDILYKYNLDDFEYKCRDKSIHCPDWMKGGECTRNPGYMHSHCALSCGKCRL